MYEKTLPDALSSMLDSIEDELLPPETIPDKAISDPLLDSLGGEISAEKEIEDSIPIPAPAPSSHYNTGQTTSTEERALSLLGSGISAEQVAGALGVTPSRISQLLAEEVFSKRVAELRYTNLQKHNERDGQYDSLEDKLITKLERSLPLLVRPESILKAITVVNGAKRRGQSGPQQVTNTQNVVNLILPQVIADKFSVNGDNQVTKAGEQELITMASGNLLKQVEDALADTVGERAVIEYQENKEHKNKLEE